MAVTKTTQEFVPIKEVRDGVAILKDSSLRAILMTSSLNFALKSPDEQEAVIFQFQAFLNSLDFSIQIYVESRRLDIGPYLRTLEERSKTEMSDLMRVQIREYIEFVRTFTDKTNIMTKNFFIIVPYTPPGMDISKGFSIIPSKKKKESLETFEENRNQLEQRVSIVKQGITRCGVRSARLGTEEIIEVYYKIFNPGDAEQPLINQ